MTGNPRALGVNDESELLAAFLGCKKRGLVRLELSVNDQSQQLAIMDTGCYGTIVFSAHCRTIRSETAVFYETFALRCAPIRQRHLANEGVEPYLWLPAESLPSLRGIAKQRVHLSGSKITGVDGNDGPSVPRAPFVKAVTDPFYGHIDGSSGGIDKFTNAVLFARGDYVVVRLWLLEHQPLNLHVVVRVPPISQSIEVPQVQTLLQAQLDARQRTGDFACDERFPAQRRFMIEENAVTSVDAVRVAVVHRNPVGVELRDAIRTARIEGGTLSLWNLTGPTVQLRRRGLIKARPALQPENANGFEESKRPQRIRVRRVLRLFERNGNVALSSQVVHLVRPNYLQNPDQARCICHVSVMQNQPGVF